uniref:Uncharacterized protein n=1 Tax=viral metagenome TaxID=1070528 RepID=A0A6C0E8G2_9ZZZZ
MDSSLIDFEKYNPILDKYKVFVWDFDYTLLKIHAYSEGITQSQVEGLSWNKLSKDHFSDPIFFRDFVSYLLKHKKTVAIISFGTYNVIKAYLDRLFGNPIFGLHNIYTPLDGNRRYDATLRPSSNKNQYLIDLVRSVSDVKYNEVIMFDDSKNILEAAEKDLGIKTVLVQPGVGFTRHVMDNLLSSYSSKVITQNKPENKPENIKEKQKKKILIEGFTTHEPANIKPDTSKSNYDIVEGFNNALKVSDQTMVYINILVILLLIGLSTNHIKY